MMTNRSSRPLLISACAAFALLFVLLLLHFLRDASDGPSAAYPPPRDTDISAATQVGPDPAKASEPLLPAPALIPVSHRAGPPDLLADYGSPDRSAQDDLELVHRALERFWLLFKNPDLLPVGSNEDIVGVLSGRNPEGLAFVNADSSWIDHEGRLLDRWGTPLDFHPWSLTRIDIRSAGPDLKPYTEDDLVRSSLPESAYPRQPSSSRRR